MRNAVLNLIRQQQNTYTTVFLKHPNQFHQPTFHYDWWMFPLQAPKTGVTATTQQYSVDRQDILELLQHPQFINTYLNSINKYLGNLSQFGWNQYPIRYAKMLLSLAQFLEVTSDALNKNNNIPNIKEIHQELMKLAANAISYGKQIGTPHALLSKGLRDVNNALSKAPVVQTQVTPIQPIVAPRQPVAVAKQPVAAARMPVAAARKPVAVARKPVAVAKQPVAAARTPVAVAKQPVAAARKPVAAARKPVAVAKQPVAAPRQPVATTSQPSPVMTASQLNLDFNHGILDLEADAYVNAASINRLPTTNWGGIAGAIFKGLPTNEQVILGNHWNNMGQKIAVGDAVFSEKAGSPHQYTFTNGKKGFLVHAGSPQWTNNPAIQKNQLMSAYFSILEQCHQYNQMAGKKIIKIAVPPLGVGIYGVPPQVSAQCAGDALSKFNEIYPGTNLNMVFGLFLGSDTNSADYAFGQAILQAQNTARQAVRQNPIRAAIPENISPALNLSKAKAFQPAWNAKLVRPAAQPSNNRLAAKKGAPVVRGRKH